MAEQSRGEIRRITIKKTLVKVMGEEEYRWVVSKEFPEAIANRGKDTIEWSFAPDSGPVSAHFQFTYRDKHPLFKAGGFSRDNKGNARPGGGLTRDKTAVLKPGETLVLDVHDDACRRTNPHYYAVWIQDPSLPDGGTYAVGPDLNPPPDVTVGP